MIAQLSLFEVREAIVRSSVVAASSPFTRSAKLLGLVSTKKAFRFISHRDHCRSAESRFRHHTIS
ncbi:MAG: hypothetical protein EAZ24_13795 [Burkholderiales bacterium]|nr:MAG: hypothetical protein EAZ24_13795 [Burkholderiales bacterium]